MVALDKDLQSRQLARELVRNAKNAQQQYAKFSQEKIDNIVKHIAFEAARHAEELAKWPAKRPDLVNGKTRY